MRVCSYVLLYLHIFLSTWKWKNVRARVCSSLNVHFLNLKHFSVFLCVWMFEFLSWYVFITRSFVQLRLERCAVKRFKTGTSSFRGKINFENFVMRERESELRLLCFGYSILVKISPLPLLFFHPWHTAIWFGNVIHFLSSKRKRVHDIAGVKMAFHHINTQTHTYCKM